MNGAYQVTSFAYQGVGQFAYQATTGGTTPTTEPFISAHRMGAPGHPIMGAP